MSPTSPTIPGLTAAELAEAGLLISWSEPVARVTLAAPERRNAQSPHTWSVLARIGQWAQAMGDQLSIVVLDAQGVSFSAGLDRRMFTPDGIPGQTSLLDVVRADDEAKMQFIAAAQSGFRWLREVDAVTMAVVEGHAIGAGFQLALAADVIVPSHDAVFAMKETSWGLVPDLGGTAPMVRGAGYGPALIACATGRNISAAELATWGLALPPTDDAQVSVDELISALSATPPGAVSDLKVLLRGLDDADREQQWLREAQVQSGRLTTWAAQLTQ